jgi:hypothetical protein
MRELLNKYKVLIFTVLLLSGVAAYQPAIQTINTINPIGGNLNINGNLTLNNTNSVIVVSPTNFTGLFVNTNRFFVTNCGDTTMNGWWDLKSTSGGYYWTNELHSTNVMFINGANVGITNPIYNGTKSSQWAYSGSGQQEPPFSIQAASYMPIKITTVQLDTPPVPIGILPGWNYTNQTQGGSLVLGSGVGIKTNQSYLFASYGDFGVNNYIDISRLNELGNGVGGVTAVAPNGDLAAAGNTIYGNANAAIGACSNIIGYGNGGIVIGGYGMILQSPSDTVAAAAELGFIGGVDGVNGQLACFVCTNYADSGTARSSFTYTAGGYGVQISSLYSLITSNSVGVIQGPGTYSIADGTEIETSGSSNIVGGQDVFVHGLNDTVTNDSYTWVSGINDTLTGSSGVILLGNGFSGSAQTNVIIISSIFGISSSSTNTLVIGSGGATNNTGYNYLLSITIGTAMTLSDSNGNQFQTPVANGTYPFKPGWRLAGTGITGTATQNE